MEVIIVDDEPAARRTLHELCACESDLRVIGEYGDAQTALAAIRLHAPDLVFLDIQIGCDNGVELARSLPSEQAPLIVFVTAYDHYALEAFEVSATDYLLKPFDDGRFRKTLERIRRRRDAESTADRQSALTTLLTQLEQHVRGTSATRPRLLAESGGRLRMLEVADVELIEGDRNYVKLILGRDVFHVRSTLQQAEKALQTQPILRISRSCLVNMNHVREVGRTPRGDFIFVLAGGMTVTSSEGFRDAVRHSLAGYKVGATDA